MWAKNVYVLPDVRDLLISGNCYLQSRLSRRPRDLKKQMLCGTIMAYEQINWQELCMRFRISMI